MRQFIIAAAMALGLIALWAAILPLTAQPASTRATFTSPAMTRALARCHSGTRIDGVCAATLAKALMLDATVTTQADDRGRLCRIDGQTAADLASRD
jgi:hypothetical protein